MTTDTLIHESPTRHWRYEDEVQALADHFANPPKPAPSEGGDDGGYTVPTQRSAPDPDWPGSGHMTHSEWALAHEPEISGRAIAFNAFHRNGGERFVSEHTDELPEIPELVYRGSIGPDAVVPRSWRLAGRKVAIERFPDSSQLAATRVRTRRNVDDLIWFLTALGVVLLVGAFAGALFI